MAIVLLGSSALVIANLIIDFVYTLIDPRIDMQWAIKKFEIYHPSDYLFKIFPEKNLELYV